MSPQPIIQSIWSELQNACIEKNHAWRTPTLATVDAHGYPNARTVVLREVDTNQQNFVIYTDRRSPKVQDLLECNRAEMVFWSTSLNWQLRAKTEITVLTDGTLVEQAWDKVKNSVAATDYLRNQLPGAVIQQANDTSQTTKEHQLCVLRAHVEELDWLELSRAGNRRLKIQGNKANWLVP